VDVLAHESQPPLAHDLCAEMAALSEPIDGAPINAENFGYLRGVHQPALAPEGASVISTDP
jgi:hypothetical protein